MRLGPWGRRALGPGVLLRRLGALLYHVSWQQFALFVRCDPCDLFRINPSCELIFPDFLWCICFHFASVSFGSSSRVAPALAWLQLSRACACDHVSSGCSLSAVLSLLFGACVRAFPIARMTIFELKFSSSARPCCSAAPPWAPRAQDAT